MSDDEVPHSDLPSNTEVPTEDLPAHVTANSGDEVPPEDLPQNVLQGQYGSHPVLAGLESFARGASGHATDALASGMRSIATKAGLPDEYLHYIAPSKEQLTANEIENPDISKVGDIAGNVATLAALPESKILGGAKAGTKIAGQIVPYLGKESFKYIGSAALDQALKMMALQGTTEGSKYLTGEGDPSSAVVAHIAKAGGIGLVSGGLYGAGTAGASKLLGTANIGNKIASGITGLGHGLAYPTEKAVALSESMLPEAERSGIDAAAFKFGHKIAGMGRGKIAQNIVKA